MTDKEIIADLKQSLDWANERENEYVTKINKLEKENAELKEEMQAKQVVLNDFKSRVETVTERFNRRSSQLIKAKEIIKMLSKFANHEIEFDPEHPEEHTKLKNLYTLM